MLARAARIVLLLELGVYVLAAWVLVRSAGWSVTAAAGLMLLVAIGLRAGFILFTFAHAALHASPVPPSARIGSWAWLRMVACEFAAFVWVFSVVQPFETLFMAKDRLCTAGARPPLLLLHGYECNRGFWWRLRRRLEAAGWVVATVNLERVFADIDDYAEVVAARVDQVRAATGAQQVILLGHSMGGLTARAYLRRFGAQRVARLVTLGAPHGGSALARLAIGVNGRQLRVGCAWISALGTQLPPVPTTAIFSWHDNFVTPQESATLAGARNVGVAGVGHLAMAIDSRFAATLLRELKRG